MPQEATPVEPSRPRPEPGSWLDRQPRPQAACGTAKRPPSPQARPRRDGCPSSAGSEPGRDREPARFLLGSQLGRRSPPRLAVPDATRASAPRAREPRPAAPPRARRSRPRCSSAAPGALPERRRWTISPEAERHPHPVAGIGRARSPAASRREERRACFRARRRARRGAAAAGLGRPPAAGRWPSPGPAGRARGPRAAAAAAAVAARSATIGQPSRRGSAAAGEAPPFRRRRRAAEEEPAVGLEADGSRASASQPLERRDDEGRADPRAQDPREPAGALERGAGVERRRHRVRPEAPRGQDARRRRRAARRPVSSATSGRSPSPSVETSAPRRCSATQPAMRAASAGATASVSIGTKLSVRPSATTSAPERRQDRRACRSRPAALCSQTPTRRPPRHARPKKST